MYFVAVWELEILATEVHRTVDIDSEIARKLFLALVDAILVVAMQLKAIYTK